MGVGMLVQCWLSPEHGGQETCLHSGAGSHHLHAPLHLPPHQDQRQTAQEHDMDILVSSQMHQLVGSDPWRRWSRGRSYWAECATSMMTPAGGQLVCCAQLWSWSFEGWSTEDFIKRIRHHNTSHTYSMRVNTQTLRVNILYFINCSGKDYMTCNIYKAASSSWSIFRVSLGANGALGIF